MLTNMSCKSDEEGRTNEKKEQDMMKYTWKKSEKEDDIVEDVDVSNDIKLEIVRRPILEKSAPSYKWGWTPFEPQREVNDPNAGDRIPRLTPFDAPEKKLTVFALRLALIEKTASGLGQLAFIWATVVLLGGFASALKPKDFWFVTVILVIEGARLFSRSRELEWQHFSTRSLPATNSSRTVQYKSSKARRLLRAAVRLLPYSDWVFLSKNISGMLYWLQVLAAAACVALSLMRIWQQDLGDDGTSNKTSALNVFYSLALAEALMFLLEKGYWSWRISYGKLVERVSEYCDLRMPIGVISLRRFFYDAYSRCIDGSVFDGLKMDLVSFAKELLHSDSSDEQLMGARIIQNFVKSERFSLDPLRNIGSSTPVIERLIEMLNWKEHAEEEIRRSAAEIVSNLAAKKQQALRLAAIPGAMESIASLLQTGGGSTAGRPYEAYPRPLVVYREDYEFTAFNLLGLLILKRLARDDDNCGKIGNARGLLARIIDLSGAGAALLRDRESSEAALLQIKIVRRGLRVVLMLVSSTGETGKTLRREVSQIVYAVSNLRELLQYGGNHLRLQKLGMEILTSMAMDEDGREKIGATGSMLRLILDAFFRPIVTDEVVWLCNEAGEALAMLILESSNNCERVLREGDGVVGRLVAALGDPVLRVNAGRILRGLCAYSAPKSRGDLGSVAQSMPMVLKTIMEENEKEKLLEVSIGLALQILRLQRDEVISSAGIRDEDFAERVVQILRKYENPESKVPRMRRFLVGLSTILMQREKKYRTLFRDLGMEEVLKRTAETTSELECFNVFSGSVGLSPYAILLSSLVDTALQLLVLNDTPRVDDYHNSLSHPII